MKKRNKGITLVALVITVIILLILAGITINMTVGHNGIITKAQQAAKMQKIEQMKESIKLELIDAESEAVMRGEKLEKEQIKDIVSEYGEIRRRWGYVKAKRKRRRN